MIMNSKSETENEYKAFRDVTLKENLAIYGGCDKNIYVSDIEKLDVISTFESNSSD